MRTLGAVVVAVIVIVAGLSVYLAPNDFTHCGKTPSGTEGCATADVIVAVSGGDTSARTQQAIDLYEAGWAPYLVFSGAARDKTGPSNAEAMRREAIESGVPENAIIIEELGETTRQNAENTQDIVTRYEIDSVILVTSAYHQRRASLEFEKRANDQVDLRNYPVSNDNQWSGLWWVTPGGWVLALSEFLKIMIFYVGGTR